MRIDNNYKRYLAELHKETNSVPFGRKALDDAFSFPITGVVCIETEPSAGGTAIGLEISEWFGLRGDLVLYFDLTNSIFSHRLQGIDKSKFFLVQPSTEEELQSVLLEFSKLGEDIGHPCVIFDGYRVWDGLVDIDLTKKGIKNLVKGILPSSSLVFIDWPKRSLDVETKLVTVKWLDSIVEEETKVGHEAVLTGSNGTSVVYLNYDTGRLSKGYEEALNQESKGTSRSGTFLLPDGGKVRGFWNFQSLYDKLLTASGI